jgi:hypothetical protein
LLFFESMLEINYSSVSMGWRIRIYKNVHHQVYNQYRTANAFSTGHSGPMATGIDWTTAISTGRGPAVQNNFAHWPSFSPFGWWVSDEKIKMWKLVASFWSNYCGRRHQNQRFDIYLDVLIFRDDCFQLFKWFQLFFKRSKTLKTSTGSHTGLWQETMYRNFYTRNQS